MAIAQDTYSNAIPAPAPLPNIGANSELRIVSDCIAGSSTRSLNGPAINVAIALTDCKTKELAANTRSH